MQGLVIEGSIRDGGLIAVLGFPVFHAGFAPATSVKELAPSVGEPVEVGGVTVTPGDQIVADSDAVLVVPAADWPAVETAARQIQATRTTSAPTCSGTGGSPICSSCPSECYRDRGGRARRRRRRRHLHRRDPAGR